MNAVIVTPQLAGWVQFALIVATLVGFAVMFQWGGVLEAGPARTRVVTACVAALLVATVWGAQLSAFYYDLDPYCRYAWWDFLYCH